MSARRRSGGGFHGIVAFIRRLIEAIRHGRNGGQAGGGRPAGGPGGRGRNPQPQCPVCHRFVPVLCTDAGEGAEPCFFGVACGCCTGPHLAKKDAKGAEGGEDGGKFQTSAQKAAE